MLRAILNKSWGQHPTRHQLYGHLPPITKTIQVRRTRYEGHCWRSRNELISDVLLWTPTYGRAKAERPARTYVKQLCEETWCSHEDLSEAMNDREKWREKVRDIRASGTTWWWWSSLNFKEKKFWLYPLKLSLIVKSRRGKSFGPFLHKNWIILTKSWESSPLGVVAEVPDDDHAVREFELQLFYCVQLRTNALTNVKDSLTMG